MKKKIDMLSGPLAWPLITYAVPIMLTSVLQLLFNAADLVVVGAYCGSFSVAAVGATGAITNLIVNLFIGLSVGTGVAGSGSRSAIRSMPPCPWLWSAASSSRCWE